MAFAKPKNKPANAKKRRKGGLSRNNGIKVCVRIRPKLANETNLNEVKYRIADNHFLFLDPPEDKKHKYRNRKEFQYNFSRVFSPRSTQSDIFNHTLSDILPDLYEGKNATVFCYGSTGSGKTYTMIGEDGHPGLMFNTISTLFRHVESKGKSNFEVRMSYFEIYNEHIRDLLVEEEEEEMTMSEAEEEASGEGKTDEEDENAELKNQRTKTRKEKKYRFLDLRTNEKNETLVVGLSEHSVKNLVDVNKLLLTGNSRRICEPNSFHEHSSRSHAILQIKLMRFLEKREAAKYTGGNFFGNNKICVYSKLNLIDLAGSESLSRRGVRIRGTRQREGKNINLSLLALGTLINTLADACVRKVKTFAPVRRSVLTRILGDSLLGNCKTVMVATIAPLEGTFDETRSTLKYACRTNRIKTVVSTNVRSAIAQGRTIEQAEGEIEKLKFQLKGLKREKEMWKKQATKSRGKTKRIFLNNDKPSGGGGSPVTSRPSTTQNHSPMVNEYVEKIEKLSKNLLRRFQLKKDTLENVKQLCYVQAQVHRLEFQIQELEQFEKMRHYERRFDVGGGEGEEKRLVESKLSTLRIELENCQERIIRNENRSDELKKRMDVLQSRGKRILNQLKLATSNSMSSMNQALKIRLVEMLERNYELENENYSMRNHPTFYAHSFENNLEIEKLKFELDFKNKIIKKLERLLEGKGEEDVEIEGEVTPFVKIRSGILLSEEINEPATRFIYSPPHYSKKPPVGGGGVVIVKKTKKKKKHPLTDSILENKFDMLQKFKSALDMKQLGNFLSSDEQEEVLEKRNVDAVAVAIEPETKTNNNSAAYVSTNTQRKRLQDLRRRRRQKMNSPPRGVVEKEERTSVEEVSHNVAVGKRPSGILSKGSAHVRGREISRRASNANAKPRTRPRPRPRQDKMKGFAIGGVSMFPSKRKNTAKPSTTKAKVRSRKRTRDTATEKNKKSFESLLKRYSNVDVLRKKYQWRGPNKFNPNNMPNANLGF